MSKNLSLLVMTIAIAGCSSTAYQGRNTSRQTAAPPGLQKQIFSVIENMHNCKNSSDPFVISSEAGPDQRYEGRTLIAGEVDEVWATNGCGAQIRFLFRLGPDENKNLKIIGFERIK